GSGGDRGADRGAAAVERSRRVRGGAAGPEVGQRDGVAAGRPGGGAGGDPTAADADRGAVDAHRGPAAALVPREELGPAGVRAAIDAPARDVPAATGVAPARDAAAVRRVEHAPGRAAGP